MKPARALLLCNLLDLVAEKVILCDFSCRRDVIQSGLRGGITYAQAQARQAAATQPVA